MNFTPLVSDLAFCADALENLPAGERHGALFRICAGAMRILAGHAEEYDREINDSRGFVKHFQETIQDMVSFLKGSGSFAPDPDVAYEKAFVLVEELAVFMREKHLRSACGSENKVCRKLLDFFESSGHWRPGDGTMVTEYYYVVLPVAAMSGLINKLTDLLARHDVSPA